MHWVFSQKSVGELNGWQRSFWGGITTLELAKVIDAVISSNLSGLYQISNNKSISKYDLISLIVKEFELPIKVNAIEGIVCDKSIWNSIREEFSFDIASYEKMISDIHQFMLDHKMLYTQYLGE